MDAVLVSLILGVFVFILLVVTIFVNVFTLARFRQCACPPLLQSAAASVRP